MGILFSSTSSTNFPFNPFYKKNKNSLSINFSQTNYPTEVLIKRIYKASSNNNLDSNNTRRLLYKRLLQLPSHINIMKIFEVRESVDSFCVVMEKMNGREIFDFLVQAETFTIPIDICKCITKQLILGLLHLHSYGILHRDIKAENVMFRYDEKKCKSFEQRYEIALIDFDSCKIFDEKHNQCYYSSTSSKFCTKPTNVVPCCVNKISSDSFYLSQDKMKQLVGTPAYMSPEVLKGCSPSTASDLWSVGILLFIMLTGSPPVQMQNMTTPRKAWATLKKYKKTGFDFSRDIFNENGGAGEFCMKLLEFSVEKRIKSCQEALSHPWLLDNIISMRINNDTIVSEIERENIVLEENFFSISLDNTSSALFSSSLSSSVSLALPRCCSLFSSSSFLTSLKYVTDKNEKNYNNMKDKNLLTKTSTLNSISSISSWGRIYKEQMIFFNISDSKKKLMLPLSPNLSINAEKHKIYHYSSFTPIVSNCNNKSISNLNSCKHAGKDEFVTSVANSKNNYCTLILFDSKSNEHKNKEQNSPKKDGERNFFPSIKNALFYNNTSKLLNINRTKTVQNSTIYI